MANYDILGNIAILKFPDKTSKAEKLRQAQEVMKTHPSVETILEKMEKVSGRLRTIKTKHIIGKKNLVAEYHECGCRFKLKVDSCYFSPRLANERLEIARLIAKMKNPNVLVMFAGVGPFSIIIAKNSKTKKIVSIELGKECCKYAQENVILNKVDNFVEVLQGDVKKVVRKLKEKFDVIVMPRPNLKDTFLKSALSVARKNTKIIYYGFSAESKLQKMLADLHKESKSARRKIKITNIKEAGDIAPYEHRYRIEMTVLN